MLTADSASAERLLDIWQLQGLLVVHTVVVSADFHWLVSHVLHKTTPEGALDIAVLSGGGCTAAM